MFDQFIEENKNRDICLVVCDVGVVKVMDRIGKFRFWYNGIILFLKGDQFCLFGIVIDSVVNIFVYDIFMIYIFVIDKDGKLICFLNIVCLNLMWLVLDEDDYV